MMGRSPLTEEQAASRPFLAADLSVRLQQLVAGWQGAERHQPLSELHRACLDAAGPGGRHLLPARLVLVRNLDETQLQAALRRLNGMGQERQLRFKFRVAGRFDAALVPIGPTGELPDRWLLAIEEQLGLRDQVALYAHALGHLLLNNEQLKMEQLPALDARDGYAHRDMLAELRMLETVRQPLDRRVLETYRLLSDLLGAREESPVVLDQVASDLRRRLAEWGWRGQHVEVPYVFTGGRVFAGEGARHQRRKLRLDALLRAEASLPVAAVQTIHAGEAREEVVQRLKEYAHHRLAVPFAYLLDNDGTVHEFDWTASEEPVHALLTHIPSRETLFNRWLDALSLTDRLARDALLYPYEQQQSRHRPRYYQEAAINRAVIAVLQAKRGLRQPRILLTLATGTGKTKIAFQLIWKLKRSRAIRNVLYLTDRDWLLSQAMDNEFAPFGDARERILGEAKTSRDILFATYQAMADTEARAGLFRDFPTNFFDVILVDECHRGSAQADSRWRDILEYFESAVQIGMTATPLSSESVQTDEYFGKPLYTYSLRTGINDGFLAPYRVRRVLMGEQQAGEQGEPPEQPAETVVSENAGEQASLAESAATDEEDLSFPGDPLLEESAATMLARTNAIAQHLATYMRQTDPLAKTIVFCVDQQHAENMRLELERACSADVMRYRGYIERIVSDEGAEGKRALGRFSTPEERTPVIVTTSRLLSTGVDVPTCKNIVLARPVGSLVEFKQMIGRGSRLYEPEKTWFTIIDYAGAINRFFDSDFDGDPERVEVEPLVPQSRPEPPSQPEKESVEGTTGTAAEQAGILPTGVADDSAPVIVVKESSSEYPQAQSSASSVSATTPAPTTGEQENVGAQLIAPAVVESAPVEDLASAVRPVEPPRIVGLSPCGWPDEPAGWPGEPAPTVLAAGSEPPIVVRTTGSGRTIQVIGEYVYDLGPDGKTLLRRSSYRDYSATALKEIVKTPDDLRARWLSREQREALRDQLAEEGVDLQALAITLRQPEVDPLDLLAHVAFGQEMPTRGQRVERLYREHADFFNRYQPEARTMLKVLLEKYIAGEAPDVSDTELFKVPPLQDQGTFVELAKPFGGGPKVRNALKELQQLLYSA